MNADIAVEYEGRGPGGRLARFSLDAVRVGITVTFQAFRRASARCTPLWRGAGGQMARDDDALANAFVLVDDLDAGAVRDPGRDDLVADLHLDGHVVVAVGGADDESLRRDGSGGVRLRGGKSHEVLEPADLGVGRQHVGDDTDAATEHAQGRAVVHQRRDRDDRQRRRGGAGQLEVDQAIGEDGSDIHGLVPAVGAALVGVDLRAGRSWPVVRRLRSAAGGSREDENDNDEHRRPPPGPCPSLESDHHKPPGSEPETGGELPPGGGIIPAGWPAIFGPSSATGKQGAFTVSAWTWSECSSGSRTV
ncbi:hypothetical protein Aph02nite_39640 [Actinoplanes philippinensis]|uniref:proline-rich domain-containing protein n=1 Tax=Actinoplanes philippinensis TaxID=35752 RepID=UPI001160AA40|nr:hypothetical protein [Actinoplanes philippinensis]GIE78014.1 hypothetical protein Aph02nite_39640 [Actinoplanes philippinensis]